VSNEHTYTIDWQPDYVSWAIDGKVGRTVYKNDTYNTTDNKYHFPQTPSRVQLSLWPAGLPTNGKGTIEWAGGLINWDSPYMQNGYYYAQVKEISVECYDPPSGAQQSGSKSYYYLNTDGLEEDVAIGNNNTILGSMLATGDKPDFEVKSQTEDGSKPTQTPETVPGISGGGSQQISGSESGDEGASPSASAAAGGSSSGTSGFEQGDGSMSQASTVYAGSAGVALLGFFVAALML
jgi:beta-glucanase (GH16 family)